MSLSDSEFQQLLDNLPLPEEPRLLYDPVRYIMGIGGKRIRPKLVFAGCGICGGDIRKAIPAATAVESLHNFTLIHDDIMDNALTRRGKETVHSKWNTPVAILSGDALFASAFAQLQEYASHDEISKERYAAINRIFLDATVTVCEGQARDMDFESREDVQLDEYLLMIRQKTAALISASLQLGACVAGADQHKIDALGFIGDTAGIAFQIQDDLLDAVGNPEIFGKKPGGDIREGKKTWLTIMAFSLANVEQKAILSGVLQNPACSDDDVKQVISIYHDLGVVDKAKSEIRRLYDVASEKLSEFPENAFKNEIKSLLNQLNSREN